MTLYTHIYAHLPTHLCTPTFEKRLCVIKMSSGTVFQSSWTSLTASVMQTDCQLLMSADIHTRTHRRQYTDKQNCDARWRASVHQCLDEPAARVTSPLNVSSPLLHETANTCSHWYIKKNSRKKNNRKQIFSKSFPCVEQWCVHTF